MSDSEARFCDAFVDAVYGGATACPTVAALSAQAGFAVYRNTILKACVDALAGNYPSVVRLTGEDWFRAAALEHARAARPVSPSLLAYGDGFPDYLERTLPEHKLVYLAGVARLDRLWMQAHTAGDEPVLDAAALGHLAPARLGALVLAPHAAARWSWCADMPLASIWRASRKGQAPAPELAWRGEGLLLTRPRGMVEEAGIGPGAAAFLDACAAAQPVEQAAAHAWEAEPGLDLALMLATLLRAGAIRENDTMNGT